MGARKAMYGCTALVGLNKKGILKPDADGYFRITVGGFNVHNHGGSYYPLDTAKSLFEESSSLMRRVRAGVLKGEYGHPKRENMNLTDFTKRLNEIYEEKVCCHFKNVELVYDEYKGKTGFPQVGVVATLKPSGPFADALEKSLLNPNEEVCFSVRAAVEQIVERGQENRYTHDIVTWDYVTEGGIPIARKYFSIGLEELDGVLITPGMLDVAARDMVRTMGLESDGTRALIDLQRSLGWDTPGTVGFSMPRTLTWA